MCSVDGRLLDGRWTEPSDGTPRTELLKVYAAIGRELKTDAWMFGKNTAGAVFPEKFDPSGPMIAPAHRRYSSANVVRSGCSS